jgi:homoserine O-acetyltransferase
LGKIDQHPPELSAEEEAILQWIPADASVLDLGCGDGHLLAALKERGNVRLMGVEVDGPSLIRSARRGLDVIDYDLNQGLPAFIDGQFDVVILSATLQAVANVEDLFDEMIRVGKQVIISFPNFGYRALREDYVARGRSPKARGQYHYEWYNTPNRRFPTVADVHDLCRQKGIRIEREIYFDSATNQQIASDDDPNLNADTAILAVTG